MASFDGVASGVYGEAGNCGGTAGGLAYRALLGAMGVGGDDQAVSDGPAARVLIASLEVR
jgi:hypothetical protein